MLFSIGRSATRRLASTNFATSLPRSVVLRAATKPQFNALGIYRLSSQGIRGIASAGRSKKVSTSASVVTTPAKKRASKPAKKPASKPASKPAKKPTKKPTGKQTKAKAKAKAKPKPKAKPKRPVSEERKAILERQSLKRTALYAEPKTLPEQPYRLYITEMTQNKTAGQGITSQMASFGRDYRALPSSRIEELRSVANQNKLSNAAAYKAWVESHPVQEIYDANKARRTLKKKFNYPKRSLKLIRDERLPKKPATPFGLFTKARWASGEYTAAGAGITEAAARIGTEWKGLTAAERQPYEDLAHSLTEHYTKEANAVLNRRRSKSTKSPSP
ncbi:hypothetical protein F4860DRAFT_250311 [Xylaria cubensis]|nr:hypothetical protein F4860DRAFT_250311 [Xylaria cubensis]